MQRPRLSVALGLQKPLPPTSGMSPIARGAYPRLFVTLESVSDLRAKIGSDASFRARWQTSVTQFESASGIWATAQDPLNVAFAAFLMCVRRPDDDLGLRWSLSWQGYLGKILSAVATFRKDGTYPPHAIGLTLIFDCLYPDLTPAQRAEFAEWNERAYLKGQWLGNSVEVYDNGASDEHAQKLLAALVSAKAVERLTDAYDETVAVAETNDWMGYGFGLGREWHDGYPSRHGLMFLLLALKNAGGYTDAETTGRMLTHLRDAWQLVRQAIIPHPSAKVRPSNYWVNDKFHTQDAIKFFHRQLNVGSHMAWALALLPGAVDLSADGMSDQPALANSETDYLGYLTHVFNDVTPGTQRRLRDVLNYAYIGTGSSAGSQGRGNTFWSFPAWLVLNAQERPEVTPEDAGIPLVRRFWPGTLEWTFIRSSHSPTHQSVVTYRHRKYGSSNYEEGTRQNGSWTVHRDGPLLVQRGETGHSTTSRRHTWAANGTVSFVDPSLYAEFELHSSDDHDGGSVRQISGNGNTRARILAAGDRLEFGSVTHWHADARVVALSSDLTKSYNSSVIQTGSPVEFNAPKISRFTREFVAIRRGADGTDREKVFTYDRITLLDPKFQPRYNLCPATDPDIDGVETAHVPWGPEKGSGLGWFAEGPTRWDYTGATQMIYSNAVEPSAPIPGNGKVCVTWLQPSGSGVAVQKLGGTNARSETSAKANGDPNFNPWNAWLPQDDWASEAALDKRAYVGLYTVSISPVPVSRETRFMMACEVMAAHETPAAAEDVPCDAGSVAARCGSTVVVFGKDRERAAGYVDVPEGVSLVVVTNLLGRGPITTPVSHPGRMEF